MPGRPSFLPVDTISRASAARFSDRASRDIWALGFNQTASTDIDSLASLIEIPDPAPSLGQFSQTETPTFSLTPSIAPANPLPVVTTGMPTIAPPAPRTPLNEAPPVAVPPTPSGMPAAMPTGAGASAPAAPAGQTQAAPGGPMVIDRSSRQAFMGSFVNAAAPALASKGWSANLAPILAAIPVNEQGHEREAPGSNYYGIKGKNPRTGASRVSGTWEEEGGQRVNQSAEFRVYDNPSESVADFIQFIEDNPRYAKAVEIARTSGDPEQFIREVHRAGYATDSKWSDQVLSIARQAPPPTVAQQQQGGNPQPMANRPAASGALDIDGVTKAYQGVPYTYGGAGGRSDPTLGAATDCSGFASAVFRNVYGVDLAPHTDASYNQLRGLGASEVSTKDARPGDVVYYMGAGTGGAITHHMGIYAGDGRVMDMAGSGGVKVRDVGHAGKFVILRDPRINAEPPKMALEPPPIVETGIAEQTGGERLTQRELTALLPNAGAPSPSAPAAPPPASPGSFSPAGAGPEQAMWSPDGPVDQGGAFQAATGRSGGAGVMQRGPLSAMPQEVGSDGPMAPGPVPNMFPEPPPQPYGPPLSEAGPEMPTSYNDPTSGGTIQTPVPPPVPPSYTLADGRTEPPTPTGQWEPVRTVPNPQRPPATDPGQWLAEDSQSTPVPPAARSPYDEDQPWRPTLQIGSPPQGPSTPPAAPNAQLDAPVPYGPLLSEAGPAGPPEEPTTWYGRAGQAALQAIAPAIEAVDAANEWLINSPVGNAMPQAWGRELAGTDQISREVREDQQRLEMLIRRFRDGDTSVEAEIQALTSNLNTRTGGGRAGLLAAGERNPDKGAEIAAQVGGGAIALGLAPSAGAGAVRNVVAGAMDPIGQGIGLGVEAIAPAVRGARSVAGRNGFSGESGGSGFVPSMSDARNAAQGGLVGAYGEQMQEFSTGEDVNLTPQELLARMAGGAALGVAAGRRMRGQGGRQLGSGVVPEPPRPPSRLTVEVIQGRMDKVRGLISQAEASGDRALETDARNVLGDLQNDMIDAMAARRRLEPAIASDVGRRADDLPITEARAERTLTQDAQTGFSGQPARPDELSGPVSVPVSMAGRQNAVLPFDPASAASGGAAGSLSEGEDGEGGDPWRTATGMVVGAAAGRFRRQPGKTFAFGAKPGERLEFNVKVVPLSSLVTSHDDALRVNRAFPQELQPRVRERTASSVQINKIVQTFDPEQVLVDTHRVDSGPMIVGEGNVVESGNGRTIALRRLATENPEAYQEYVAALRDELPRYGLADDALAGIDQPVLIRERVTPMTAAERAKYAADANVGIQARMAPVEQAMQDAGRFSDGAVARIVVGEDQTIDEALMADANGGFRRAFMGTVPETEWGELLTADGNLNPKGLARVKDALLAKTYQGSAGARLTTAFVDSLDSGIKNVQHGIMGSLPAVSKAEARIAAGEIDAGLSITNDMAMAADVYSRLRRQNNKTKNKSMLSDYLAQSGMFEGRETTPFQDRILAYLDQNARSPKRIRAMLDEYARTVDGMAGSEQTDMFGLPIPQATKEEVLDGVLRRLGADPGDSADLGRVGASSDIVEGAGDGAGVVPAPGARVAEAGAAGSDAAAPSRIAPEESLARFQQARGQQVAEPPTTPAPLRPANLGPADELPRGGPEGTLNVQGAPPRPARLGAPMDAPRTGGPEGRLIREGAPPEPANLPPAEGMPATSGPEGSLKAPPTYSEATLRTFQERIREPERAEQAARDYQRLIDDGASPEALATFLRNAQDSRWWDRFDTLRYASMLSDPVTHGQNAIGSIQMGTVDVLERPLTALLDAGRARLTGGARDAFLSESSAQVIGMAASAKQGIKDAAFIMAHGLRPEDLAKLDRPTRGVATDIPGIAPRGTRRAAAVDTAMEAPLRALSAADALFRGTFQGGHLAAEATRAATKLNDGKPVTAAAVKRLMDDPDVAARAAERAAQAVLQEDRTITRAINAMRAQLPAPVQAALSVAVPYIKAPFNIVAQGVGMTPAGVISLIGDIKAGKPMADRERRVSRMLIGAGVMAWASYENLEGLNTGGYPESEAERSTLPPGWRPYSRKVELGGETYYVPLALMGPVGIPAMLSVLTTEQYKKGQAFTPEMAAKVAQGVGQLAEDQTFMRSIADFNNAISKGGNTAMNYLERQVSQFSPHVIGGGGVGRRVQAILGEPGRDPDGVVQAWLATLPYGDSLADTAGVDAAPIRRDVLGRPSVPNPSGAAALVPIRSSVENDAPVIAAFRSGGEGLPRRAPESIRDPSTGRMVELTPDAKERWKIVFGREVDRGWQVAGRPRNPRELRRIEADARERAAEAVRR